MQQPAENGKQQTATWNEKQQAAVVKYRAANGKHRAAEQHSTNENEKQQGSRWGFTCSKCKAAISKWKAANSKVAGSKWE